MANFYDLICTRGVEGALLALEERVAALEAAATEPEPEPQSLALPVPEEEK